MAIAAVVVGCKANDTNVKTVKERVDAGEIVWFSEPGTKLPSCKNSRDWIGIQGTPSDEQERLVLGKQRSVIGTRVGKTKMWPCYRIGSDIAINEQNPKLGSVGVQAIGIARLDLIKQRDLKGRYFEAEEEFTGYTKRVASRVKGDAQAYVYILNLNYVAGSAANEKVLQENDKKDGYEETSKDGDNLGCNTWSVFDNDTLAEYLQPILEGKVKSFYKLGSRNCVTQGAIVELKERFGATVPALTKVKVKKVKRFKVSALNERHFVLDGFDFKILKGTILEQNKKAKAEFMTVIDFEVVPSTPRPLAADCPSSINLSRSLTDQARVHQDVARCARPGDLTEVVTVIENETIQVPVRVKSRIDDSESETVILEFERLAPVQEVQP
jgi:hypothetical protein